MTAAEITAGTAAESTAETAVASDASLRQEALDPTRSFIVQAPAGSGKTELLIQRFLVLLARARQPEEIAAITFTRKAAGEMRNRLLDALAAAVENPTPDPGGEEHRQHTLRRAGEVLARNRELGWNLLETPARLRIQTIDSFCAGLSREYPLGSGLGEHPGIAEDSAVLYQKAARATLAEVEKKGREGDAVARLLPHLDNHLLRVEGLLCAMLARRDQWLRHMMPDSASLRTALETELARTVSQELNALREAMQDRYGTEGTNGPDGPGWSGELSVLARYAAAQVRHARPDSPIAALDSLEGLPTAAPDALPQWRGLAELLTTGGGTWRKNLSKNEGFPVDKASDKATGEDGGKTANSEEDPREQKGRMQALLSILAEAPQLASRLRDSAGLPDPVYGAEQWEVMESLLVLLPRAVEHLREAFRAEGALDYVEVALSALRACGGDGDGASTAPGAPGASTAGGAGGAEGTGPAGPCTHLLVDEFQDTSRSQFELFRRLTRDWPGDGSRTLFLVGDPMQSIYRFREAEVGLFLQARKEGLGAIRLQPLTLTVNFRSSKGLVDWSNHAFPAILPAEEDIMKGAVPFSPAFAHHGPGAAPAVQVHPWVREAGSPGTLIHEAEAERVAEIAARAREDRPGESVAILVRARGHLRAILPALGRKNLSYRAVEIEGLAGRPAVQDLLSLTRALLHPGDRVAWLSVLRAPWCGLTLADLLALAGDDPQRTVWDCMKEERIVAALSADGRERLQGVVEALAPCLNGRARRPLRRWIEGAWLALGGPACLPPEDLPNAGAYLALLEELEGGRESPTADRVADALEGLYAAPDPWGDAGLQVMTIHKAKGLEFDTVILPGLGKQPGKGDSPLLRWAEVSGPVPGNTPAEGGLLMAPLQGTGAAKEPIYEFLARLDREKERHETGRLLYVAVTRAKQRLHLLGHTGGKEQQARPPHAQSLLRRLWGEVEQDFLEQAAELGTGGTGPGVAPPEEPPPPFIRRIPSGWTLPPAPPSLAGIGAQEPRPGAGPDSSDPTEAPQPVEYSWAGETARHVGTLTHRLLCKMATLNQAAAEAEEGPNASLIPAKPVQLAPDAVRGALATLGVPPDALADAADRVIRAVEGTLASEKGRWVLHGHTDARSEYPVTHLEEGRPVHSIIDRTFIDEEGIRWIVDFKTGRHEGGDREEFLEQEQKRYQHQLQRYAEVMARLEPGRPIRLGLYFPLLDGWREWEPLPTEAALPSNST